MGHRSDRRHILQQLHVGCGRGKGVVANNRADRFATELAIFRGIDVLVEAGLGNVRRKFEVFQQLGLGGVEDIHLDVLAEVGAVHHQLQAAPGRLQLLQLGRVQDFIHLGADLSIQLNHHLVHQGLIDRLAFFVAFQQVGDKRCHALASDIVTLIRRRHAAVGHDLVEERAFSDGFGGSRLLHSSIRHTTSF